MNEGKIAKIAVVVAFISLGVLWLSSLNSYVADSGNSILLNETGTALIIESYDNFNR